MSINWHRITAALLTAGLVWALPSCASVEESTLMMRADLQSLTEELAEGIGLSPKTRVQRPSDEIRTPARARRTPTSQPTP